MLNIPYTHIPSCAAKQETVNSARPAPDTNILAELLINIEYALRNPEKHKVSGLQILVPAATNLTSRGQQPEGSTNANNMQRQ
ncbi:hypothetical protein BST61_g1779 [Cercospora zeina]